MNVFRYRLRPVTPWATPLQADSLFGALCWEVVRRQGEPELRAMLDRFRKGDPPFVLSNAFPGDLLPCPLVLGSPQACEEQGWVTREEFTAIREGRVDFHPVHHPPMFREIQTLHRGRESAYEQEETTWSAEAQAAAFKSPAGAGSPYFSLFARVSPEWTEPLRKLLVSLGTFGFGRKRGLGRGQFEVDGPAEPCPWLEPLPFESGFVTLSDFVPQESDPARGRWSVRVKYPKGGGGNSLKGRLLQLGAGSCFQCPGRPRRWYGGIIPLPVSPHGTAAVHYGLALSVGIKWPTDISPTVG